MITTFFGKDFEQDLLSFYEVDLTGLATSSAELKLLLNTTGQNSAELFIPENISDQQPTTAGEVSEPSIVALMLAGLAGLGFARRPQQPA